MLKNPKTNDSLGWTLIISKKKNYPTLSISQTFVIKFDLPRVTTFKDLWF